MTAKAADFDTLVNERDLAALIDLALREDLGDAGDITTESLRLGERSITGVVATREDGIVCGLPLIARIAPAGVNVTLECDDGDPCVAGDVLARLGGSATALLGVERVILNFVCRLGGIATLTGRYVEAVTGTRAVVCDTRKTTPGWRRLEKYAVACGGGTVHRLGLYDAALYKDNHLALLDGRAGRVALDAAVERLRVEHDPAFVEVEVDTLVQLDQVLALRPGAVDIVLLDNMTTDELRDAVRRRDAAGAAVQLEASGSITLENIGGVAATGVERIAIGALTHSAPALDVGMDLEL